MTTPAKVSCPLCGEPMTPNARHSCRNCSGPDGRGVVGRPQSESHRYAASLGIRLRTLYLLGGMERLKAMSEDARATILNQRKYRAPAGKRPSLAALGYHSRKAGRDTHPEGLIWKEAANG